VKKINPLLNEFEEVFSVSNIFLTNSVDFELKEQSRIMVAKLRMNQNNTNIIYRIYNSEIEQ